MKLFYLLRPYQWLKNLMLLFPPLLGGILFAPGVLQKGLLPFAIFCLASSATYIFNDLKDAEQDRLHPRKQHRPIASGTISSAQAILVGSVLCIAAILLSLQLPTIFMAWLLAYLGLSIAYSTVLKDQPVFDIFCIASGFVFRLFAGGAAFSVEISDWLFLSVLFLAIFLSAGKRLAEKITLGTTAGDHRKSLAVYTVTTLESFMCMSGAAVLVTYTLYVITKHKLVLTVPLCCFGLFRYMMLVKSGGSGDPTESLLKDPVLFLVGLVWVVMVIFSTYIMV
ncbi:MAG: decaprenyl-phosphate phosphoribosyltransferase [Desulfuromonadales bacterium]|nr:decaprenyl-phosphate phosphoribosyltransferase [Desulfuromonadales bacterium]